MSHYWLCLAYISDSLVWRFVKNVSMKCIVWDLHKDCQLVKAKLWRILLLPFCDSTVYTQLLSSFNPSFLCCDLLMWYLPTEISTTRCHPRNTISHHITSTKSSHFSILLYYMYRCGEDHFTSIVFVQSIISSSNVLWHSRLICFCHLTGRQWGGTRSWRTFSRRKTTTRKAGSSWRRLVAMETPGKTAGTDIP